MINADSNTARRPEFEDSFNTLHSQHLRVVVNQRTFHLSYQHKRLLAPPNNQLTIKMGFIGHNLAYGTLRSGQADTVRNSSLAAVFLSAS